MPRQNSPAGDKSSNLGDTIFAVVHLLLIVAVFVYGVAALFRGNVLRFVVVATGLAVYYFLVLHKAVLKEIDRRRKLKAEARTRRP
jgi:hypothetical protein